LGLSSQDWKLYALKIIKKDVKLASNIEQIKTEMDVMMKMHHPNILKTLYFTEKGV